MAIHMSEDEWKEKLTPEQYKVLRQKGTEAPFTGSLLNEHGTGDFVCAACGAVVFKSNTKFESGSGWPSFYDTANTEAVKIVQDNSFGMSRTEVECANCGSHLGHVFNDAYDQPTGQRFCINSVSLDFKSAVQQD
jgi:peptide-methionine (R)-S-oxide reductase